MIETQRLFRPGLDLTVETRNGRPSGRISGEFDTEKEAPRLGAEFELGDYVDGLTGVATALSVVEEWDASGKRKRRAVRFLGDGSFTLVLDKALQWRPILSGEQTNPVYPRSE